MGDGLRGVGPLGLDGWAVGVGIAGRWEWLIPPPAAQPTGNAAGASGPTLRVWRTCRLEGVPETCFRG